MHIQSEYLKLQVLQQSKGKTHILNLNLPCIKIFYIENKYWNMLELNLKKI